MSARPRALPPGGRTVTFDLSGGKRQVSSPVAEGHVRTVVRPPPSHPSLLTLSPPSLLHDATPGMQTGQQQEK